jgi:DNA-binding XRE family transcriptional regulator
MELKIGNNIKRLRKNKGMTQEQLAELLNISSAAVSKWESGDTYPAMEESVARCEKIGDMFTELRKQSDEIFLQLLSTWHLPNFQAS